jgi:uncharacterized protein involved in exopolysaccharide biosynthesis
MKKGDGGNEMLKELEMFSGNKIVENEMEILKSRTIIAKVVHDLNLTVSYFQKGDIRAYDEIFKESPIWIQHGELTPLAYEDPLFIYIINRQVFELQDIDGTKIGQFNFGSNIKGKYGSFRVFLKDSMYRHNNDLIKVYFHEKNSLIDYLQTKIDIELLNQKSTVLKLSLESALPNKGKAILAKLIETYSFSALEDKNREATATLQFIDQRLGLITGELGEVEKDVENYKSSEGITDLSVEGNLFLEKVKENDTKLNEVDIQIKVLDGVENYLKSSQSGVAPATLMVSDPVLIQLLSKLNELELQKEKYVRTVQPDNPILGTINTQILNTKAAIRENIANQKQGFQLTRASLKGLNSRFESAIRTIPRKEREFVNIKRQQGIKESLFLMLLQKKEETAISYASTVTDSRLVDEPYSTPSPIKPKRSIVYLIALIFGILLPAGAINLREAFNNVILSKKEIEDISGVAVFGEIGMKPKEMKDNIIDMKSISFLAEQFRSLRTNLQYAAGGVNVDGRGNAILLTSSIGGEGKSFVSINLTASIALLDKKVIVLELDLRKPRVSEYLGVSREMGISNYLVGQVTLEEIIKQSNLYPNMFVLPSFNSSKPFRIIIEW